MKKYFTTINGSKHEAEFLDSKKIKIDEKFFEYDYKFVSDNVIDLRIGTKNYLIDISEKDEDNLLELGVGGNIHIAECKSELEMLAESLSGSKGESKLNKEIHSPMPGIIVKMNVIEGQNVRKGDVLLVLEAMKMENEIKAAKDCMIRKINVSERNSVEKNELLLILE